jgi:Uma2 family endonuclease
MVTLNVKPLMRLSLEQFHQLCQANPTAKLELTEKGELVVMSPTGGETGNRNIEIAYQLQGWSRSNQLGIAFDSSTMFQLPSGALRSPDASWIERTRWEKLTDSDKQTFPPIIPDFVVELRSPSDRLKELQDKMTEYINNGTQLGWLIDPLKKQVEIYHSTKPKEVLSNPTQLDGENLLPGFVLILKSIL